MSVAAGTYTEAVYINKRIVLIGVGTPTIDVSTLAGDENAVTFDGSGADNAVISGFRITGATGGLRNGISCKNSSPTITNNIISGNACHGISCNYSSPLITNNTISGNYSCGISCGSSSPLITNNAITGNFWGISCNSSSPLITNNVLTGNEYGILCSSSSPTVTNNTISGNTQHGIYCNYSSPTITNNIISENSNGIYCNSSFPAITNNNVWGNGLGSSNNYYNCSVGTNDISANPQFIGGADFHLGSSSPCINAGSNTAPAIPLTDKDGNLRIINSIVDMGAYEFQGTSTPPPAQYGSLSITSTPSGAKIYLNSIDTGSVTTRTFANILAGTHIIRLTLSGYQDWYGTATVIAGSTACVCATLTVAPAHYFQVVTQHANIETAGVPFSVSLVARNANGGTITSYTGNYDITWILNAMAKNSPDGFSPIIPNNGIQTFAQGIAIAMGFTLPNAGTGTLSVSDGTIRGTTTTVTIKPAVTTQFKFAVPATNMAGQAFSLSYLKACDLYGNVATHYQGNKLLSYSVPGTTTRNPVYPNPVTFDHGIANLPINVTLCKVEETKIHIEDGAVHGDSGTITVRPGTPHHFEVITANNQTEQEGIPFSVTIRARDIYGNLATGYNGNRILVWTWTATNSPNNTYPTRPTDGYQSFVNGSTIVSGFILVNAQEMPVIAVDDRLIHGESTKIIVITIDTTHAPELSYTGGTNYVSDGLHPESGDTGTVFDFRVKYRDVDGDGPQNGYPRVHILRDGAEISGSPFSMRQLGTATAYDTGVNYYYTTRLAASNAYSYFVEAYDISGQKASGEPTNSRNAPVVAQASVKMYIMETKWGSNGSGDGQFSGPHGVAVDTSGNVFVADSNNNRIQKFDSDGTFITKWGSSGSGDGQFSYPCGVAVDTSGNVFVADYSNNRIQKFTPDGKFITKWGSNGSGAGQFSYPRTIAVDTSGNVFVADCGNNRIQKFAPDGTLITKWGSYGSGNGQFDYPKGVAVDTSGNVFVADTDNHRIQKFKAYSTGYLSGKITRSTDSKAIIGAMVEVFNGEKMRFATTTDTNGGYCLLVPAGSCTVRVTASGSGYGRIDQGVVITENATTTVNFSIAPVPTISLPPDEPQIKSGKVTLTGKTEKGATLAQITIKDQRGNILSQGKIYNTNIYAAGNISVIIDSGELARNYPLSSKIVIEITIKDAAGNLVTNCYSPIDFAASTGERFTLYNNLFNPTKNEGVTIKYELTENTDVSIMIYDFQGSLVKTLVDSYQYAGIYTKTWNGRNDNN
ncbi:MAG: right-handed parallel beta-helix repeat-containing protein [bacterium]